jgi:predicted nucleic acid-binding protein
VQPHHPQNAEAARALHVLKKQGEVMAITQQNIIEFWAVTTRPVEANGLGWGVEEAGAEIASIRGLFLELPELPLQDAWERLVQRHRVTGKNVHDARLVAAMAVHGVGAILSFNVVDFARYTEIMVLRPAAVI